MRLVLIVLAMAFQVMAFADVEGIRLWHAPESSRLVFDLDSAAEHRIFSLRSPDRLVIDIDNSKMLTAIKGLPTSTGPVKIIRWGTRDKTSLRVVLDLREPVEVKSFPLVPNNQYKHRLVIDLYPKNQLLKPAVVSKPIIDAIKATTGMRDIIVAIDAGHGGEDPGAIGHGGVYEKKVVLSIAKKLEQYLIREKGFQAALIRTGDYYVGLRDRTKRAREANADLFISIHADAFSSPRAKGSSVFALSKRGATSEAARWLADKENSSDLIGGVGALSLDDKDDVLAGVLLDLSMTASLGMSLGIGQTILNSMGGVSKLHKRRVEQAGFAVLKSPDIPSLLIETGFLSNPGEARKLKTSAYQKQMARAIFTGIREYFQQSPPPGTYLASIKNKDNNLKRYVIAPGDTLSMIALRHDTSMNSLKKLNGLKSSSLRVGQVIKVPAS
ncbi:MAG: N-acetylmuramoyl-L-alanine amidase [Psychrobacter glaciei]